MPLYLNTNIGGRLPQNVDTNFVNTSSQNQQKICQVDIWLLSRSLLLDQSYDFTAEHHMLDVRSSRLTR